MCSMFLLLLCAALCAANSDHSNSNIEHLMDNVLVLRVPYDQGSRVHVDLTCGDTYHNQPVFWKKDGDEIEPALQGNQVTVTVVEMNGGNYSCHRRSDGKYLNHTLILVRLNPDNRSVILEEKSPQEGHIHCSAQNYKGSFRCSWTRSKDRPKAAVLLVKAERHLEEISCVLDADGSGVSCQDTNCQFNEEVHSITLTVYIRSYARLEAYTTNFFLRDIVTPEKLPNLTTADSKVFSWGYPESWEEPCTYFRLQFEVKVVHSGNDCSDIPIANTTTEQTQYEVNVKAKRFVFCVRAQDMFTKGPYSQWSYYKVLKNSVRN